MSRRKSREVTMMLLYEMSINKDSYENIIENFKENTDICLNEVDMEYINRILKGIQDNNEAIDSEIEKHLVKWKLNRLAKIDLAILRVCTYEMLFEEDIPLIVSVNEGVELAKKYSADNLGSFINGVLGNILNATNN